MLDLPSIVGLTPFERPDVGLLGALARAGALAVLDLGRDADAARAALGLAARRVTSAFGVRLSSALDPAALDLPALARVVVLDAPRPRAASLRDRTLLVQVCSVDEARRALDLGAQGLIVKGHESGGRVGEETSFVLLQHVLGAVQAPVWVQGGIGLHTAAACIAAGARGVVLDSQLAMLEEATLSAELRRALGAMDGSETAVTAGMRLYARPSALAPKAGDDVESIARQLGATDPARELVALGQDAAFARPFAERFGTAERLVHAMQSGIGGHVRQARALRPLARHSPLARELGIAVPIVQGPMTRVSDRAAFAEAVAVGGGLPFLALSLARGAEAGALLGETRARLGDRPWGVGLLGFLPPEVRDEQLALILEARPPVALIAGGRPAQAAPLEKAGIPTFLHVPSPGLLDLFLKEGGRRFVFEGRECGGHVGPLSSFVLWEAAVTRLLARGSLSDVSILFAGGIHDALSARMVATLAAPLAARGAKLGVLMGTAYLFTEEAVACGAIGRVFQEEALACERTTLVETAPGHATRCVEGEFARAFDRERQRLEREERDPEARWTALERMNLGRLRIAAKGLRREGDRLLEVDEGEQRQEGMFMIGQVAALRTQRCTIDALHRDVADRSSEQLEAITVPAPLAGRGRPSVDVAIVGMACIFPDAPDLEAYWSNIVTGRSSVREVPEGRWDASRHFDAAGTGDKTPSRWGGFIPPIVFDPGAFGIPPRSVSAIDPTQLLSLEVARRALEDAGYASRHFDRERASVVFGTEGGTDLANDYGFRASFGRFFDQMPAALDAALPRLTEDSFPGVLANVVAGRIANRLDLRGVNYTVDAACASSLAAVDVACKELATGSSDLVLAGGADLHNGLHDYLMFASVHALSPTGQCRPFDAKADGIALGEGIAAVVLKRLDDALQDGDRVYAVIKGVAGSSDGKSLGLTAPRKEGQLRALERAYEAAGISPATVGLVEAHGTGTVVGDRTELSTLTEFFEAAGAPSHSCTLGSVKAQIGHTKCAAGMAGLIKAALSIHHGVLPPTIHVTAPNPGYDLDASPFVLRSHAAPWTSPERTAAVSAFGFGGTNFHAVLSGLAGPAETPRAHAVHEWPAELFVVRGVTPADAERLLGALDALAASEAPPKLRDLAAAAAQEGPLSPARFALVASSLAELRTQIAAAREGRSAAGLHRVAPIAGEVAMLFPGQGSQRPGMLADLFVAFPELRELLALGAEHERILFPGAAFSPQDKAAQQRAITDTRVAQPVLGLADLAMARLLASAGVRPAMTAGHSYGELVALAAADCFDAATLLSLSRARARCVAEAAGDAPGTMAAVKASPDAVRSALGDDADVVLANHNAPDQVVIAGSSDAIAAACERLGAAGLAARPIPVACAFHSPIVAGAREAFARHLAAADIEAPSMPVYANATAAPYDDSADDVRAGLAAQVALPVRFVAQIEAMYAAGARVFVEAGPGGVLTDLVGRILRGRPHAAIACDQSTGSGVTALLSALARLVAAGVAVDTRALFTGRATPTDLADLARHTLASTAFRIDGASAQPVRGELPPHAGRKLSSVLSLGVAGASSASAPEGGEREAVVREYLRTMRELVEGQRQVMLQFLGAAPTATLPALPPGSEVREREAVVAQAPAPSPVAKVPALPAAARATPMAALLSAVCERTGYPEDMLDPDLDLEADLGIDSIKRIEILGATRDRLGLDVSGDAANALVEQLATAKTIRGIVQRLEAATSGGRAQPAAAALEPAPRAPEAAPASEPPPPSSGRSNGIERHVMEVGAAPPSGRSGPSLAGRRFAIMPDRSGLAVAVVERLIARGASARLIASEEALGELDGLVCLATFDAESSDVTRTLFSRAQEATRAGASWLVAVTGLGGRFGHGAPASARAAAFGVSGLLKSLAKEWPAVHVRAVDLSLAEDTAAQAEHVVAELQNDDPHLEVGYLGGERHTLVLASRPSSIPAPSPPSIDERSVVLLTGGARGITGRIALAMARRFRCKLELVGRSALPPDDEDPDLRAAVDATDLRRALLARAAGSATPSLIEARVRELLAAREIRETLTSIRQAGSEVDYHAVDVRDDEALGALVDRIRERHGRIDGVVHGAGLIEDKLLRDKTLGSFDRVFETKVAGARTLARKLADEVRFFVLFSSVSGAFGNRGQTDYAAANDALDKLAHHLHGTVRARVLSINWGPWRGAGMVRPELEREYERRGISLIAPDAGIASFFDELLGGSDPQVVLTAGSPSAFQ